MVDSENKLFAPQHNWNSVTPKEQQRLQALTSLGLRQSEMIPVFEEATQTAAHFLGVEISILGFIDQKLHWFKSAVGLSRLGLMNDLARNRQLLRQESFCTQVVETSQVLVINDTNLDTNSFIQESKLVRDYGIRTYLGAPLIDAAGNCLGTLAVMDRQPRNFTTRDIEFLQIIARWSMSEFERNRLLKDNSEPRTVKPNSNFSLLEAQTIDLKVAATHVEADLDLTKQIQLELLSQLTQELRTPLTSILGMAGVLGREIYGPLTTKQKEYLEIIQHSGKYLLSLVNEITELDATNQNSHVINLVPVDIEMLCKQVINTLEELATRRDQNIRLSIEPGRNRFLSLDKDKVRQILYNLIFSVIQISAMGSIVRIHVTYKEDTLCVTVWVSHPWLGDGITDCDAYFYLNSSQMVAVVDEYSNDDMQSENPQKVPDSYSDMLGDCLVEKTEKLAANMSREKLGLLLSCHLAELHNGQISIQGSPESGYRYVLSLPLKFATASTVVSEI
ncbi:MULTISPECIES: GAF domain-containing sensor histidine kinase [unclassified Anabaena]|uniref:GAF domain-containing sensor histidine kinase n=1 Tax=unclassified Anabaena TaxID=2619674 RepID=UPI0014476443|nr:MULTISPECIES: GAF domain-containing sensor histidine kinase [unclassified Anabaena]MTJ10007.1 GAF domain-containing sensor histidine kinase [Anabaena sp. UHCC 0204]MTJ55745.1 GAF domain-containing sensor histidine kinase [Anabaena sp. UHCC 0253]